MRGVPVGVGVALVALALAACGGGAETLEAADGTQVFVGRSESSGADALLEGPLAVLDGCLGAGEQVVVWPNGTKVVDDDPLTVTVPGNRGELRVGDQVRVGGGVAVEPSSSGSASDPLEVAGVTVPATCAGHGVWMASPAN
jgi:hypothetical protein